MIELLNYAVMLAGGLLVLAQLITGRFNILNIAVCAVIGVLVIVLSVVSNKRREDQSPSIGTAALGIVAVIWGVISPLLTGTASGIIPDVLIGIVLVVLGIISVPFKVESTKIKMYNRNGGELGVTTQIRVKNDDILAKSILLGSMPETIYMRPEEICKAVAMVDISVIRAMPRILYKGWKVNRTASQTKQKLVT